MASMSASALSNSLTQSLVLGVDPGAAGRELLLKVVSPAHEGGKDVRLRRTPAAGRDTGTRHGR